MKRANPILVIAVICFSFVVHGQPKPINRLSPDALVADLYREHNRKHSPFFQTRSRALLYKYFEKKLADMIWKDAVKSKGEVGVIDGDPLYDAQDMEIKHFAIAKPRYEPGRAMVDANFENLGQKKTITFIVVSPLMRRSIPASLTGRTRLAGIDTAANKKACAWISCRRGAHVAHFVVVVFERIE